MDNTQLQETLQKGIRAAKRGKTEPARKLLGQVVQADPKNEEAWMWLARSIEDPTQKADCLQQILAINPNNQWANDALSTLLMSAAGGEGSAGGGSTPAEAEAPPLQPISGGYEIELIKCPNCHGDLDLKGGKQVKAIVCRYCGSIIDLTPQQAAVIGQANHKVRPLLPLKLGTEITIDKTLYEFIGWLRYEGWDDEDRWRWDEWLLASENGEYRWLSYDPEAGFTMQKRIPVQGAINVKRDRAISVPGGQATVKERAPARVIALAGELTWRATEGERIFYVDARKGDMHYSVEQTPDEIELLAGKTIPEEAIWMAMGNQAMVAALKKTGRERSLYQRLLVVTLLFVFLSCSLAFLGTSLAGNLIHTELVPLIRSRESVGQPFTVSDGGRLHEITLIAKDPTDQWEQISVNLVSDQAPDQLLFSKTFGAGDTRVSHKFIPGENGTYHLKLAFNGEQMAWAEVTTEVRSGLWSSTPLVLFGVICIILSITFYIFGQGSKPPYSHQLIRTIQQKKE